MLASAYVFRRTPRQNATRYTIVLALAACVVLSGCSTAVVVDAPPTSSACEQVLADAPIKLLGQLQRETQPSDAAAVAWGDPPIVLACGVEPITSPTAQVVAVDSIEWIASPIGENDGTVFTTVDTAPVLQVRVPAAYRPEIDAVVDITATLPLDGLS